MSKYILQRYGTHTHYIDQTENLFVEVISKSAENIGKSAEYTVKSKEISKNICRNLNLVPVQINL